ncbi:MAG: hypothetical protein GXO27_04305 [Chlorobi bacterium]|nr:hypothetical protein [Chlorobiota bacterium]
MRRIVFLFMILLLGIGCERDDLCVEKPAVRMQTIWTDAATGQRAPVRLMVLYRNDTLIPPVETDSLAVPLPVDTTGVRLVMVRLDSLSAAADTLDIEFRPGEIFISKACGFKTVYYDARVRLRPGNTGWIALTEVLTDQWVTDTVPHVKIYY